jgi:hypothetical protein
MVRAGGAEIMNWTTDRSILPGFYWFKGSVSFTAAAHEIIIATVVELTGFPPPIGFYSFLDRTPIESILAP